MGELRLILLAIGLLLVVTLIGWEIYRRRAGGGASFIYATMARWFVRLRSSDRGAGSTRRRNQGEPTFGGIPDLTLDASGSGPGVESGNETGITETLAVADHHGQVELGNLDALIKAGGGVPAEGRSSRFGESASQETPLEVELSDDQRLVVSLTLMAPVRATFSGERLLAALEAVGLEYGTMGLFHYFDRQLVGRIGGGPDGYVVPIFSVTNVVEPGTFVLEDMDTFTTTGLCLFMQLPGPADGTVAFDLMLDVGEKLARELGGELRDGHRSSLTAQGIQQMREQVVEHCALLGRRGLASTDRVLH